MGDNVKINPSTRSSGIEVATDEIDNVHYPIYKVAIGANGEVIFVDNNNPIPVNVVEAGTKQSTDAVAVLDEISKKLSILIKYQVMLHKVDLEDHL